MTGEVIRTIRVKNEYDQIVKEDTKKEGISVNSFFNKLLDKYSTTYRFVKTFPCLVMPMEVLKEFLISIPKESVKKTAETMGSYIPKHYLFLRAKKPNLKNTLELIEKCTSQHANWHNYSMQNNNGKLKILLRHRLGSNWSLFIETYYKTMFKQLFNSKIETEIGPESVIITIKENMK